MTLLKFFNRKRDSQRIMAMTNKTQSHSPIDQVGITAGEVWHVLADQGGMSVAKLAKQMDAPRDLVMQAVGWHVKIKSASWKKNVPRRLP